MLPAFTTSPSNAESSTEKKTFKKIKAKMLDDNVSKFNFSRIYRSEKSVNGIDLKLFPTNIFLYF